MLHLSPKIFKKKTGIKDYDWALGREFVEFVYSIQGR